MLCQLVVSGAFDNFDILSLSQQNFYLIYQLKEKKHKHYIQEHFFYICLLFCYISIYVNIFII